MKIASAVLVLLSLSVPAFARTAASRPALHFELPARAGVASLDSLRGRVVLVGFWASWCEPCRLSFPWMAGLHKQYAERGLTIVAVNLDKSRDPADMFLAHHPAPFTVASIPKGKSPAPGT